ncbi:hypothetical protein ACKWTF_010595 [Chironomus riparius]
MRDEILLDVYCSRIFWKKYSEKKILDVTMSGGLLLWWGYGGAACEDEKFEFLIFNLQKNQELILKNCNKFIKKPKRCYQKINPSRTTCSYKKPVKQQQAQVVLLPFDCHKIDLTPHNTTTTTPQK